MPSSTQSCWHLFTERISVSLDVLVSLKQKGGHIRPPAGRGPLRMSYSRDVGTYSPLQGYATLLAKLTREREFFTDNLLVRIHLSIEMMLVDRPGSMGV